MTGLDRRGAAILLASAAAGGALASPARAAPGCTSASTQRRVVAAAHGARARYGLERFGVPVHVALRRLAVDRVLTDALRAGNLPAANAEARRQVLGHQHVTAIRVVDGNRVLVETHIYPFDVAGSSAPLRDRHGVKLGTLAVTIQDVVGFIRLVHKYGGADVVVRGAGGEAKSSLAGALGVRLPASGCAAVGGRTYAVRSFGELTFSGEALTVWILVVP